MFLKRFTHKVLNSLGLDMVKTDTLSRLIALEAFPSAIERWLQPTVNEDLTRYVLFNLGKSKAQLQQDLLVQFIYEKIEKIEKNVKSVKIKDIKYGIKKILIKKETQINLKLSWLNKDLNKTKRNNLSDSIGINP